jgi:hypothetical protein
LPEATATYANTLAIAVQGAASIDDALLLANPAMFDIGQPIVKTAGPKVQSLIKKIASAIE